MPRPCPSCCAGGPIDDCALSACWTVTDGTNPLGGALVRLYDPGNVLVGQQTTGPNGRACFNITGPPGQYVVSIARLCYLDAGGPVDLACDTPHEFTQALSPDFDECTAETSDCGCVQSRILKTVYWSLDYSADYRPLYPGDPMAGQSGTATLDLSLQTYRSGCFNFSNYSGARSAFVQINCSLSGNAFSGTIRVFYYTGENCTGSLINSLSHVASHDCSTEQFAAHGCATGAFTLSICRKVEPPFPNPTYYEPYGTIWHPAP